MPLGRNIAEETYDLIRHLPRINVATVGAIARTGKNKVISLTWYPRSNNLLIHVNANVTFLSEFLSSRRLS